MEPSATPWRALEDPVDTPPVRGGTPGEGPGRARLPRSAIAAAGGAVVLAVAAFVLAFGSGSGGTIAVEGVVPFDSTPSGLGSSTAPGGVSGTGRLVVVEIVGAVERPGVFRLSADSRVGDLVAAAGGYGPRVDADRAGRELNLAAALKDGDQIRVPSRDDAAAPSPRSAGPGSTGGAGGTGSAGAGAAASIDLNRATEGELDTLPGIGPVTAAKIAASRNEQPFASVDDLRTRKLVGEKTFASLKDLVTVR
jgi:competence protein ComEA